MRVRRSSDNGEQNIGFDANGNLDTTSLLAFVGAGNGFVITWYDQSGNNRNATQYTAANQPMIVNNGSVILLNNKPSIKWDGSNDNLEAVATTLNGLTTMGIITLVKPVSVLLQYGRYSHVHFQELAGWGSVYQAANTNIVTYRFGTSEWNNTPAHEMSVNNIIFSTYKNERSEIARVNGIDVITSTRPNAAIQNTNNILRMGLGENNTYFGGLMNEVIIYTTNKMSDRAGIESNINSYYSIYSTLDTDAQAFVTAAGITDATQVSAVNTLVTSLKSANIWTKMKAIYPFVGGSATSHKFNLKDPRDLDAAYRLVFNGGSTHSSSGYIGNGTNSYVDTKLSPFSALVGNNNHMSIYSNLNITDSSTQVGNLSPALIAGSVNSNYSERFDMAIDYVDTVGGPKSSFVTNTMTSTQINWVDSNKVGMYTMTRTSNTSFKAFKNDAIIGSNFNTNSTQLPNFNIYLGAWNWAGTTRPACRRIAFASVGSGLTDAEATAFYNAVQAFQTSLGRQV